jgi:membrane protein YqaA with SNARE-associated domain
LVEAPRLAWQFRPPYPDRTMLTRWYRSLLALSETPRAPLWLAIIAFAEASFFPIPPDAFLIPMVVARPDRAWRLATVCTLASVVGGAFGYLIGYELFDVIARPILDLYHEQGAYERFQQTYADWGVWVILVKGFTPIPYKIVTIASGAAHFNFAIFMAASLVTRGARFFLVAAVLRRWGAPVRDFVERRLTLVTTGIAAAVVAGFVVLRFL